MAKNKEAFITRDTAVKILELVDQGLCSGLGKPIPGQMCIEAAVCYAMGLPHGDEPPCVSPAIRVLKIKLNDATWSSNIARAKGMRRLAIAQLGTAGIIDDKDFASRVALMFIRKILPSALRNTASIHPMQEHKNKLEEHAKLCENVKDLASAAWSAESAAWSAESAASAARSAAESAARSAAESAASAAWSAASAAWSAARSAARSAAESAASAASAAWSAARSAAKDAELSLFAEEIVKILIDMKAQGAEWLGLTEAV